MNKNIRFALTALAVSVIATITNGCLHPATSTSTPAASGITTAANAPFLWDVQFDTDGSTPQSGAVVLGSPGDGNWNLSMAPSGDQAITITDTTGSKQLMLATTYGGVWRDNDGTPMDRDVMKGYAYTHDGSITVNISGLATNAPYHLVIYGSGDQAGQGGVWTVNGKKFGTTLAASRLISAGAGAAYIEGLVAADGNGNLHLNGAAFGNGEYVTLNGFQLQAVVNP